MPFSTVKEMLYGIFLCLLITSCSFVPEHEQFVNFIEDIELSRSTGNCTEAIFQGTQGPSSELNAEKISILGWNIYKGQRQKWENDLLRLSHEKDLVFLQEAPLNKPLKIILKEKKMHWNMNSAFRFKGIETGVLVASQIPPLESCGLRNDEPILGLPKTTLISSYTVQGATKRLLVANIHGVNFSLGTKAYQEQFDALHKILTKHDGPIILTGDFNNWSEKRNAIVLQFAQSLSLQVLVFTDQGRTKFFGDPVDHILYRGLEPVSNAVHIVTSSDHNPISATFRLNRTQDGNEPKKL